MGTAQCEDSVLTWMNSRFHRASSCNSSKCVFSGMLPCPLQRVERNILYCRWCQQAAFPKDVLKSGFRAVARVELKWEKQAATTNGNELKVKKNPSIPHVKSQSSFKYMTQKLACILVMCRRRKHLTLISESTIFWRTESKLTRVNTPFTHLMLLCLWVKNIIAVISTPLHAHNQKFNTRSQQSKYDLDQDKRHVLVRPWSTHYVWVNSLKSVVFLKASVYAV